MIILFIVAVIAFLFWGKMTKEEEERIGKASWIRTLIYFTLSFLVGVFYYKTYQVATIKNYVEVDGHRCAHDKKTNKNVDSVEVIYIKNRFTNSNYFPTLNQFSPSKAKSNSIQNLVDNKGGLFIAQKLRKDSLSCMYEHSRNVNSDMKGVGHNYEITYISNEIPSFSLIQHKSKEDTATFGSVKEKLIIRSLLMDLTDIKESQKDALLNYIGSHGVIAKFNVLTFNIDTIGNFLKIPENKVFGKNLNNLNFFTAADISQCSYVLGINCDSPIKNIEVNFDIPVEISPLVIPADLQTAYGFFYNNPEKLNGLQRKILTMHVKFPTLANMQLIRSLILTTLLSALFSLFLANAFFLICKIIRWFKRKSNYQYNPLYIERRKKFYQTSALVLCGLIVIGALFILFDSHIWIEYNYISPLRYVVIGLVFVCLFVLYRLEKSWMVNNSKKEN